MSALANTIRQLAGQLALLRAERERYQALCAVAYQLAGAMNAPVRFLDALADGANGDIEARQKTDDLLPVDPQETGAFPAWSDDNIVSMQAEIAQLHEDLQAAKLLAHANGEMFRAEKVDGERWRALVRWIVENDGPSTHDFDFTYQPSGYNGGYFCWVEFGWRHPKWEHPTAEQINAAVDAARTEGKRLATD
ncbi:hypothetical protein [Burkholderia pseudomallei]|uniref:hypothetical protein n=1 Tax=Burkholderia pseudomallei TaxID=28450 RepID=UPI000A19FD3B|nr:hypothetical protein [Burkholderia pseudomallei]ARK42635.1 hypothetical protein BOC60_20345 [Burkholderia pseudomallei]